MSIIHQFSIDGQIVTVPEEELEDFYESMSERGITPEEVRSFETDDGETLDIPASEREDFERSFGERQIPIRNVQRIMMDDGQELSLGEEDIRQFVQARQTGMPMSRGLLANTGIPDWYGKSREDREALADRFAAMFPLEESKYGMRNDGRTYKGSGWLGELRTADGGVATEYTSQSDAVVDENGNRIDFPTLVPTLTDEEISLMVNDIIPNRKPVPDEIMQKAVDHALMQIESGKSVFANDGTPKGPDYLPRNRNLGDAISENVVEPIEETLGHIKTQTEAQYGRDVSNAEAVAANLPFSGSVMDANEARIESVEKRLWNGDYRDTLEASRLALSIGIPEEDVRAANENGGDFASLVRDDLASRIETRQKKGDRLAQEDLNFLQKAAIGAAGMVKTIPEMANPVVGAATIGPAIMNRADGLNDGEWEVDENGNPVQTMTGDGGDLSMLKGAAGAIGERAIWGSKLPGSGKLAEKLGKGFLGRNAAQIADMVAKGDITDFIDNVIGTNVPEADAKKTVAEWAEEHLLPQGFAEDVLEAIPAHFALKGAKLLTKGGREQLKAERQAAKDEKAASDARRAAQEREEAAAKEVARDEARTRYEANLSEEARSDIENRVNDMVKTGVIPSYRHAQEVERLAAEKLGGREAGESTEAVEQAVMEAAQEVADRLATPERVTSPALERRQTEAKARENERLTKIGEKMGEEIANEKPIESTEDAEAVKADEAERVKLRKEDFEAALEDAEINRNPAQVDSQTPENGEIVPEKPVETAENVQSPLSKAYSDYVDAAATRLKGGKSDFEAANKAAQDAAKRIVETDEPLPTDAEIDEIVSRLPEKARETFANSLKQQRDWVAEQRKSNASPESDETAPSRAPNETNPTSQADGAEGAEARNDAEPAYRVEQRGKKYVIVSRDGNEQAFPYGEWTMLEASDKPTLFKTEKEANDVAAKFNLQDANLRKNLAGTKDMDASDQISNLKAEEKAAKARFKGEREQVFGEIDDIIKQKVDAVRGSWSKEIADEVDGILKKTKLTNEDIRKLNTYLIDAPRSDKPFKLKLGETGELTVNDNIDALLKTRNNVRSLGKEASKRYYEIDETPSEAEEPVEMRRLDPKLRSDPKAIAWAQKRGFSVVDGKITPEARRSYDEDVTKKTASLSKRWFPDMKVVQHKHGENIEHGQEVIDLRDTSGNTLGWFNPSNKEVHLLPGANAETVAHEIMWHGTRDWATTEAAKGNEAAKKLLETMKDVERNVPDALKNKVTRLYRANGVSSADVLFNEWGAWFTMGKGGKELESAMETADGRKWYAKALSTVKESYKDFLTAHGGNRADLAEIDGMTRDEFVDWLSKNFAGGKTLGEIGTPKDMTLSTEETLKQKARRIAYDSVAPVRDLEREIEKNTGVKIKAEDSVDAALALRPGEHEAVAINQQRQLREVKDMLKKYGLSSEDLGYYMALKAAPGRDAKIDAKNLAKIESDVEAEVRKEWGSKKIEKDEDAFKAEVKRRFDEQKKSYVSTNGSAVDPREVEKMIPEIENGSKSIEYGAARDKIREIQEDTMDALVEAGLISKEDAAKLRKEEPDYVPFKSEFDPETGEFVGRAYNNLAEKTFYEAKGRQSSAGDILAHILNDNAMAHNKAIENKAREKLAKLVEAHPELGTVSALGNRNLTEARRKQGGNANVILFKREGKTMAIELNGDRGKSIAAAFTGVNQAKLPGWMQKGARLWAATATELSPTFAIRNVTKDNIELAQNAIKEMGYVKGTKFIAKYGVNQVKSSAALAKYVTTGKIDTSSTTGKMLQEFIDNGGMIGGYGTEGYSDISRALSSEQISKEMKRGTSAVKAAASHTLHSIGYLNKMSEMTSRFNAYRTQREMGMSAKEAALWSRRTLTDFNRKGDMTGVTNVLRMFSNSTLGASAKAATGLVTTKGGLALSAGLLANGAAQALIEHIVNADDDKKNAELGTGTGKDVSEYDRKSSFWLYRNAETGKITKVGAHNGPFQLINYIGNCAMRVVLGDMTANDMAKELGMSAVELASAFSGWGEVNIDNQEEGFIPALKAFAASAVPSAAQWFVEPGLNTDYAGRKVYTDKGPSEKKPYYLRARKNTPEWAKNLSETMNRVTGGNKFVSGDVDVPAEVIQKVAESFGKNAAKDVITAYETGKAIINGNYGELESRMVPVKRDFVRDAPDSTSRYFNAKRDFEKDAAEFTGLRKTMSADERKQYIDEHPWVLRMDSIRKAINDIDELRKYEAGFVKDGRGYIKRKDEPPKELVEKWKAKRLQLQAKILKMMGR